MEPTTLVLFGATGDLAKRKIYPALYHLFVERKLPQSFTLIGLGRRELTDETFQASVRKSLQTFIQSEKQDPESINRFLRAFRYHVLDVGRKEDYTKLLRFVEQREQELNIVPNRLFYLSVAPEFFETIAVNIHASGLGSASGWKRLVIEKPFGHDLPSARQLNEQLNQAFDETEIYRIDHYLGKPMVQQMGQLLHAAIDELQWGTREIANVQITASETLGVEERAAYYDRSGAIRDMFQNHMLQLLMMLAIELPNRSAVQDVGNLKKQVVKQLRPLSINEVSEYVIRGQYGSGEIHGNAVAAYTDEPGIATDSRNDTYLAARLHIDDPFWKETPVYIRTGKRLKEKTTRIVIEFKTEGTIKDLLIIEIGSNEGIYVQSSNARNENTNLEQPARRQLSALPAGAPEAYEVLIHDALKGDKTYFAHWDEVELSWEWVQPLLDAYEQNLLPLSIYPAGAYGPVESDHLLARRGDHWWFDDEASGTANNETHIVKSFA
ncbi:glucose-6-phosphate dehydrogenase [Paenibacillus sp. GCM10023248]|uniref:glucose-6-phosphate dehydrogenase n=1 Tax=unclassified Paenibacillus TaxID=185978 RepID=UPI002378FC07|nr:glucose-6-phosphate dehydrogenase [Paenibacillus sp. MAHUQ-63]MDD9268300.1 glucose-6-phosphate dehydrogenase [Paenibacillus sp. MAHUQ-63]